MLADRLKVAFLSTCLLAAGAPLTVASCSAEGSRENAADLTCDVAIVGGGVGGAYMAFRLAPTLGERVCLFEKEAELGGRMRDESVEGSDARIGTGARRVMENQKLLFALAEELGIQLETPASGTDLIQSRGKSAYSKEELVASYPKLKPKTDMTVDHETWLYDQLRKGPARARAGDYADFRSYIRDVVGAEEFAFLRDMSRFRADFDYPLSARGYLDYLDEEWDTCCTPSYPIGGMSMFPRRMEAKASEAKARIFKTEPVTEITKRGAGYRLRTSKQIVDAAKLVVAVPPDAFDKVKGDVAESIQARPEYKAVIPVRVVVINQTWNDAWWANINNPTVMTGEAKSWRAWTTEHCLNFIEIPLEPYAVAQKVTRSVYNDDPDCTSFWEALETEGIDKVEAEVVRGLTKLFNGNGVSSPASVAIPKPKKTTMHVWPGAWYFVRAGTPFTNTDIAAWSLDPLAGDPNVTLVGESYFTQRSGWSEGAYKSAIQALAKFNVTVQIPTASQSGLGLQSKRRTRDQAGR